MSTAPFYRKLVEIMRRMAQNHNGRVLLKRTQDVVHGDRMRQAGVKVEKDLPKDIDWLKPRSPYPPVECPINIFVDGEIRLVERDSHVEKHSDDMVYFELKRVGSHTYRRTGREFEGEFYWTYP